MLNSDIYLGKVHYDRDTVKFRATAIASFANIM